MTIRTMINPGLLLASALLLAACGGSDGGLRGSVDKYNEEKTITEPQIPPIDCSGEPDLSDAVITGIRMNIIQQVILPATDDLPERHYLSIALGVEFDEPDNAQAARLDTARFKFSLFHQAQASSCEPPTLGERAVRMELTSDRDFHADYPAGSSLNDLLVGAPDIGSEGRSINSGLSGLWNIVFTTLPTEELRHRFTVEVELDSGAVHELTLDPVYFPVSLPSGDEFPDDPIEAPGFSTSFLNDTGITTCGNNEAYRLECPVAGFPLQDADVGRDALAAAGLLDKVGAGPRGYDFTKLDEQGASLSDDAEHWACIHDNVTGLVWEVKADAGLRYWGGTYTWYNPDDTSNGGIVGEPDGGDCEGSACDTHAFVTALNEQSLCGRDDWRLPSLADWFSVMQFDTQDWYLSSEYFYSGAENFPPEYGWWTSTVSPHSARPVWALFPPDHGGDQSMNRLSADEGRQVRAVSGHRGPEPFNTADRAHCRQSAVDPDTPTSAFEVVGDGAVVRHTTTNLEWQRCSLGQTWDGSRCTGSVWGVSWQRALNEVRDHAGWRMPNVIELLSLHESCSYEPAINLQVFPDTPERSLQGNLQEWGEVRYWSASQIQMGEFMMNDNGSERAFGVNFGTLSGYPVSLDKTGGVGFVRLVRDVEP